MSRRIKPKENMCTFQMNEIGRHFGRSAEMTKKEVGNELVSRK